MFIPRTLSGYCTLLPTLKNRRLEGDPIKHGHSKQRMETRVDDGCRCLLEQSSVYGCRNRLMVSAADSREERSTHHQRVWDGASYDLRSSSTVCQLGLLLKWIRHRPWTGGLEDMCQRWSLGWIGGHIGREFAQGLALRFSKTYGELKKREREREREGETSFSKDK